MKKLLSKIKRFLRKIKRKLKKIFKKTKRKNEVETVRKAEPKRTVPIVDYASSEYLSKLEPGNGRYADTVKETCRLLGYPLEVDTFFPSDVINIDYMYDRYEKMIREYLPRLGVNISYEDACKKFRFFKQKYRSQECFSFAKTDCVIWFWDWLLFVMDRGYYHGNYFDFEFYKKGWKERDEYLGSGYRRSLLRLLNNSKEDNKTLGNKGLFNKNYAAFIQRKWLSTESSTEEEFTQFLSGFDKVFVKPLTESGGNGARVEETKGMSPEQIHDTWVKWSAEGVIVEEILKQNPLIAAFNESTINTLRIYTLIGSDGEPFITMACGRFGRAGKVTDNFHQGGYGVMVDPETGTITSDGLNRSHQLSPMHPDSKKVFKGFTYPEWDKVLKAVREIALVNPKIPHVGWDIIINDKNEIELIEGNYAPGFDMPQAVDQIGKRCIYDKDVIAIAARQGAQFPQSEVWYK